MPYQWAARLTGHAASARRLVPLRWYLLGIVTIAVLPGLLVTVTDTAQEIASFQSGYERRLQAVAGRVSGGLGREIAGLSAALAAAVAGEQRVRADLPGARTGPAERRAALQARVAALAAVLGTPVVLRGAEETALADDTAPDVPADEVPRTTELMRRAAAGTAWVGHAGARAGGGGALAAVNVPVMHAGAPEAVLQTFLTEPRVRAVIDQERINPEMQVDLVDPTGTVLARFAGADEPPARPAAAPLAAPVAAARADGATLARADSRARDGTLVLGAYSAIPGAPGWLVVVDVPYDVWFARWAGPLPRRLAGMTAEVTLAVLFALWLGRRLTRPLAALGERAQAVAAGLDAATDVPNSTIREVEELRTSQLRAESKLRRREAGERMALQEARTGKELLSSVVNATADQILVTSLAGRYVLVNRPALEAIDGGLSEASVLGRRPGEVLGEQPGAVSEETDREVLRTGGVVKYRVECTQPGAGPRIFSVRKSPWRDATNRIIGVVNVGRDVTEQQIADARLRATQAELLRATRLSSMGAMASGLAHELNQPLSAASNYLNAAQRMLAGAPPDEGDVARAGSALAGACAQVGRAAEIVRRLSEFVGRGEAELTFRSVGDLLGEVRQLAGGVLAGSVLVIEPAAPELLVLADRIQIQQVLLNLVRNAAEALAGAPAGRPGRITLRAAAHRDGGAEIVVADNGPGIAPAVRERLFEPFVSTKPDGMGIGLSICRTIIEGHGGRICAESGADGTMFRIILPSPRQPGAKT